MRSEGVTQTTRAQTQDQWSARHGAGCTRSIGSSQKIVATHMQWLPSPVWQLVPCGRWHSIAATHSCGEGIQLSATSRATSAQRWQLGCGGGWRCCISSSWVVGRGGGGTCRSFRGERRDETRRHEQSQRASQVRKAKWGRWSDFGDVTTFYCFRSFGWARRSLKELAEIFPTVPCSPSSSTGFSDYTPPPSGWGPLTRA